MPVLTGSFYSQSIDLTTSFTAVLPHEGTSEDNGNRPVLYLLHGLSDNHTNWLTNTSVARYALARGFIVIMPEVTRSFYADMKAGPKYFTYVSEELPKIAESMFGFTHKRENTFVAGLSMGGYGAMKCALSRPDFFAKAASFSGALDIEYRCTKDFVPDFQLCFGESIPSGSDLFALAEKVALLPENKRPELYFNCGTEDFLYKDNQNFKAKLDELAIHYTYEEWQGDHEWGFWDVSIQKALDFFQK